MKKAILAMVVAVVIVAGASWAGDVAGTVQLYLGATHTDTSETLGTGISAATETINRIINQTITAGTNANQCDVFYHVTETVAASSRSTNDLYGIKTDSFGETVNLAEMRWVYITSSSTNAADLLVEWPTVGTNGIKVGGSMFLWAPTATAIPIANGTSDQLVILNESAAQSQKYSIIIGGSTE